MRSSPVIHASHLNENNLSVSQQDQQQREREYNFSARQHVPPLNPVFSSGSEGFVPAQNLAAYQNLGIDDNSSLFFLPEDEALLLDGTLSTLLDRQFMTSDWGTGVLSEAATGSTGADSLPLDAYHGVYNDIPLTADYAGVQNAAFFNAMPLPINENAGFAAMSYDAGSGVYHASTPLPEADTARSFYPLHVPSSVPNHYLHKFAAAVEPEQPSLFFEERYPVPEDFKYRDISLADAIENDLLFSMARIDDIAVWLSLQAGEPVEQRLVFLSQIAHMSDRRTQKQFLQALKVDYGVAFLMDKDGSVSQQLLDATQNIPTGQLMPHTSVREAMGYTTYFNGNALERISGWFALQKDADPEDKIAFFKKIKNHAGMRVKTKILRALQNPDAKQFLKHHDLDVQAQLEGLVKDLRYSA